ncbi:BT_2262 family domain-containing protein [uncultured Kriegella sp.]|uniref:BT_2262 family domain-containing protein n=1 Tax=uncultured Kriegella sp. TaxID=1798910 RepID=UPI0030DC1B83|tara:strand:+ start:10613 stop:11338 length:726 start_codon:yes stop_codon:yes gene_type:complete
MKNLILSLGVVSCFLFTACETESTGDVSEVTNFAVFNIKGSSVILVEKGSNYEDPGADAAESGVPVNVETTSNGIFRGGTLDVNVEDNYSISYSAVNKDGFEASGSRNVIVAETGNLVDNIAGLYRSTVVRNGVVDEDYENMEYVIIWKNDDGSFTMSDGIGGYYMYGRAYGSAYAASGAKVTVNGLNDYTFGPNFAVGAFGGIAMITEMTVDPTAKTINFKTDWDAGPYVFDVTLEQVQL